MADHLTARDLMLPVAPRIGPADSLNRAIAILLGTRLEGGQVQTLLVVEGQTLVGLLTTRCLFESLVSRWVPDAELLRDKAQLEERLFELAPGFLSQRVRDVMNTGVPTAAPDDRLPRLMELSIGQRLDTLPVLEEGRLLGVIRVVDLFIRVAGLALSPDDEGIQTGRS